METMDKSKEKSFISKHVLKILLAVFFLPFAGIFIGDITEKHLIPLYTFGISDIKDFYAFWIALFGTIGIAYNIYQNQKRIYHQEKQLVNQNEQLGKQQQQIDLQKKVERDNRFAKGVELLGNSSESARIGAAYNLYFLAKEFPEEYREVVFNILCSHVRAITSDSDYQKRFKEKPSNEIQTIMDLLFKRQDEVLIFSDLNANLENIYVIGINLYMADLVGANLAKADLAKAYLKAANLRRVCLRAADLTGANLTKVYLRKANLRRVYLGAANLTEANLTEANLTETDLRGADLRDANLTEADLRRANLQKSILLNTELNQAKLDGTNLRNAE